VTKTLNNEEGKEFMASQSQIATFEAARHALVSEFPEIREWTYEHMILRLDFAIKNCKDAEKTGGNKLRHFTRHHLGLKGRDRTREVRGWIDGKAEMSKEQTENVLRTLCSPIKNPEPPRVSEAAKSPGADKAKRGVLDHAITLCNSVSSLVVESGIQPANVFDGDRMQIISALRSLCKVVGIDATLKMKSSGIIPVTTGDMNNLERNV
jgi:hypothetical protein